MKSEAAIRQEIERLETKLIITRPYEFDKVQGRIAALKWVLRKEPFTSIVSRAWNSIHRRGT